MPQLQRSPPPPAGSLHCFLREVGPTAAPEGRLNLRSVISTSAPWQSDLSNYQYVKCRMRFALVRGPRSMPLDALNATSSMRPPAPNCVVSMGVSEWKPRLGCTSSLPINEILEFRGYAQDKTGRCNVIQPRPDVPGPWDATWPTSRGRFRADGARSLRSLVETLCILNWK